MVAVATVSATRGSGDGHLRATESCPGLHCHSSLATPTRAFTSVGPVGAATAWATTYSYRSRSRSVFRTTDGGRTWAQVAPVAPSGRALWGDDFLNAADAWLLYKSGQPVPSKVVVLATSDGGRRWGQVGELPVRCYRGAGELFSGPGVGLDVDFVDTEHGWCGVSRRRPFVAPRGRAVSLRPEDRGPICTQGLVSSIPIVFTKRYMGARTGLRI